MSDAIKVLKHSFNADTDHQIGLSEKRPPDFARFVEHH